MLCFLLMFETEEEKSKFEIVYTTYKNFMFAIAVKILKNEDEAEEIVGDSFLNIVKVFEKIDDPFSLKTRNLISQVTRNKAIDLYRRKKKKVFLPLIEEYKYDDFEFNDISFERLFDCDEVDKAIALLKPEYQAVLFLKYDNNLSIKEIAEVLGITVENAKKRLQRAKDKLKDAIEEMRAEL